MESKLASVYLSKLQMLLLFYPVILLQQIYFAF